MIKRLFWVASAFLLLTIFSLPVLAASGQARSLRQANRLVEAAPPEKFLVGNFVADEMNPAVVFGPVQAFAKSRPCPTAWLREAQTGQGSQSHYGENTFYLEEDCPDKVIYYVFVDQSGLTPQQWYEWRQKFHKSKAQEQYGEAQSKLEQACRAGCGFSAELRYIAQNGELLTAKSPETILQQHLKVAPLYDLNLQQKISQEK